MVRICPMCKKETCDPNNEEVEIDFCDKCMGAAIEGAALIIGLPNSTNASLPIAREKMTVNSYGQLHEVYKDEWMKQFNKERGFWILRNVTK
ncbi:hypothetical protein P9Y62_12760 [Bacillus thuringiensis]|uniref:Transcription factor zinc-finger domain-containing protein n=1 Tax=Bacillus thuringiensis HD-771 TaxID=1218175 RepID=A0A9W3JG61_BACTU|nr:MULTISPECIES: hypothetical protein [Bacillus cereus group]EEM38312.1 hypothetical protein bthur0004_58000 [Bacillus thuringiensis serovar sotto str. T04001]AFQ19386.1 hypothetical protein BTG_29965 [Bacillus thuringiensis HD-771]MDZ4464643.1 hypothetical protein [Bacillus cereus]MDZ4551208.1 hypothetical protein [Bacillus cereus]MEB4893922.1 hypothetical protein [Bacillus thuringiensis]